jgi:hypothetical protein
VGAPRGWTDHRPFGDAAVLPLRESGLRLSAAKHEEREQRADEARALADAGTPLRTIAERLGVSRCSVWRYLAVRVDCMIG